MQKCINYLIESLLLLLLLLSLFEVWRLFLKLHIVTKYEEEKNEKKKTSR